MVVDVSKCRMTRYPAAVLREKAAPVEHIDESVARLVEMMADLMIEYKGVGFAAPQAGVSLRMFIISVDGTREHIKVFINPSVTTSGDLVTNEEGCLSVPQVWTKIRRYSNAKVTAQDLDGREFTEEADGLYARALQHENDHIDGITIVDKMGSASKIANRRKLKKLLEEQQQNNT